MPNDRILISPIHMMALMRCIELIILIHFLAYFLLVVLGRRFCAEPRVFLEASLSVFLLLPIEFVNYLSLFGQEVVVFVVRGD